MKLVKMFIAEAETMEMMKHERIVEFIDFDLDQMALIMELMPSGSLLSHIAKLKT